MSRFGSFLSGLFSRSARAEQAQPPIDDQPNAVAPQAASQYKPSASLVACVGAVCASILLATVPSYEGVRNVGYLDPIGIPTKCMGDTTDVVVGQTYSPAECLASLNNQLVQHAQPVLACTPDLADRPNQLAAAVSLAYNIGSSAYCHSNIAGAFLARQYKTACLMFPEYDMAGGKVLPGLLTRRKAEMATCLKGL